MRDHHNVVLLATQSRNFPLEHAREGYREYIRWQNSVICHDDIAAQIYIESPFAHPSVMFKRDSIIAAGAYRVGAFPEDYELWLRLYHQGFRMEKLPQVLLCWRESENRLSRVSDSYAREAFDRLRAEYLSGDQRLKGRAIVYWGAGRITRRRVKHLQARGFAPLVWIDIDPKKIGNVINGARVHEPAWLEAASMHNKPFVLNYVTNHGARDILHGTICNAFGYCWVMIFWKLGSEWNLQSCGEVIVVRCTDRLIQGILIQSIVFCAAIYIDEKINKGCSVIGIYLSRRRTCFPEEIYSRPHSDRRFIGIDLLYSIEDG